MTEEISDTYWWDEAEPILLPDFVCPNCEVKGCVEVIGYDDLDSENEVRFCNSCKKLMHVKEN